MFDPKLYREACRELKAPGEKIEEVIAMTEHTNKKKLRPLRTALICVAAAAMMVVGVSAANPEGMQMMWRNFKNAIQVDRYRTDLVTESGKIGVTVSQPGARLENQDGRAILMIENKKPVDITDELAQDQYYFYEDITEGSKITVTVEGTIDEWSLTLGVSYLREDGTFKEMGSTTVTSEAPDGFLNGIFFDNSDGAFDEMFHVVEDIDEWDDPNVSIASIEYTETEAADWLADK